MEQFSIKVEALSKKLRQILDPAIQYIMKHKAISMAVVGAVILCVVITGIVSALVNSRVVLESSDTSGVEIVDLDSEEQMRSIEEAAALVIEEDAYDEVNTFIKQYYTALQEGDVDTVSAMVDYLDETEKITIQIRGEYTESYDNIVCYTKLGPLDGTYVVYAYYEVQFEGIDTRAPGLSSHYIYQTESGEYQIMAGETDEDLAAYLLEVSSQDDIVDLFNTVQVQYNEAIVADVALNDFLIEFPTRLKTEISEALALIALAEAEVEAAEEAMEEAVVAVDSTSVETITTYEVKANTTVNIRASDSLTADVLGKAIQGDVFMCTEQRANGWSCITYQGEDAYIKTEYLDILDTYVEEVEVAVDSADTSEETSNLGDPDNGNIMVITTVNIRSSASETASKLGVAYPGDQFELLMVQEDGWTKILYDGETAYIKSEFLEE
ncbi:MAG: SH3 domain-containing protein [Eubacteriales bacterium]